MDKDSKKKKEFSGNYYEKDKEAMKIEVNDKRVKITRYDDKGKEKFEIRAMDSYDDAVDFCLKEEEWVIGEGYKANHDKFTYTFVDDSH